MRASGIGRRWSTSAGFLWGDLAQPFTLHHRQHVGTGRRVSRGWASLYSAREHFTCVVAHGAAMYRAGPIGFVGCWCRLSVWYQRICAFLPLSACTGGCIADAAPHELATGVMTALVSAPFYHYEDVR